MSDLLSGLPGNPMQQAFLNAAAMMNGTDVNMDEISDILKSISDFAGR